MNITDPWIVSLDLGKVGDYTALAVIQPSRRQWGTVQEQHYAVRMLERFPILTPYGGLCLHGKKFRFPCPACPQGVSIGGILEQVAHRCSKLPTLPHMERWAAGACALSAEDLPFRLVIDHTGVGQAVADMFDAMAAWPVKVLITAGNAVTEVDRDQWHVAKRQLVGSFQAVVQTHRIQIARIVLDGVNMGQQLIKEAQDFQMKIDRETGNDSYGARQGKHDDLLLAVMIGVWYGEQQPPPDVGDERQQFATGMTNAWEALGA